jgi:hypothetical protein
LSNKECVEGVHLERIPRSKSRFKGILDLIHSYLSVSMLVASLHGSSYYVMFIDGFSRKTLMLFMKTKDEVFSQFKEFRDYVENHIRMNIKVLRLDNGGEYTSNYFKYFCKDTRTKRELIVS